MDPDTEVESFFRQKYEEEDEDEEKKKRERPPSSYGSMKSDSDEMLEEDEEERGEEVKGPGVGPSSFPAVLPELSAPEGTGLRLIRSECSETRCTVTTQQTKPPGVVVIDTRFSNPGDSLEDDVDGEDGEDVLRSHSPEPPEPVEPSDTVQTDENGQPGGLHPEQDLPHIFRSIQTILSRLTEKELFNFKMRFCQGEQGITPKKAMEGDILDFVDKIFENLGEGRSLLHTIRSLEIVGKKTEAETLRGLCKRAFVRFHLRQHLIRKHKVIREGVVQAGRWNVLDNVYVEPQISIAAYRVDPSHELRPFVGLNNLFRLQREGGEPVRTVLTTGIPGIGMTVSVGKFSLDWAEQRANKDLQFVIKLSFRSFWLLRNKNRPASQEMSVMEVIEYYYPECKGLMHLEAEDCRFLIIMDSFDCYQAPLDWENAPVIEDNYTRAHLDVLIVNIIRGTVLRGARLWILGRRAAVSQIPSKFIDVVTEIQSFSDEMKDDYLKKRFTDADLTAKIVAHYKRLPALSMLARQPFPCWILATVFERCYRNPGYGVHPPRLTPFYVSILIIQTNRRLQFYYGKGGNDLRWSGDDKQLLTTMGKMAFKMLERKTSVFSEEDVEECGLKLTEVTVLSGLCTELPTAASDGRRTFCFAHLSFQEFMAALYVFMMFRSESKNVLDSGVWHAPRIFTSLGQGKSAAGLVQCALVRAFSSPPGYYDMFLRFLCGVLSPYCQLRGYLYRHDAPEVGGLEEARRLLEQAIRAAQENSRERVQNLKECLREMTQEDE